MWSQRLWALGAWETWVLSSGECLWCCYAVLIMLCRVLMILWHA